jgi:hypothetical protein
MLSLTTIGIAILVLVTVVVIVAIFTGYLGNWKGQIGRLTDKTCADAGGNERPDCLDDEKQALGFFKDLGAGMKCCVKKQEMPEQVCEGDGYRCDDDCGGDDYVPTYKCPNNQRCCYSDPTAP